MWIALRRKRMPMVANAAPPITARSLRSLGHALRARGLERVRGDLDGGRPAERRGAPCGGEALADGVDEHAQVVELRRAELIGPRARDERAHDVAAHDDRRDRRTAAAREPLAARRLAP